MALEDQLNNLFYEIRDLIKTLNATTGTRGTRGDPGLDRNTASLDKSTQGTSKLILGLAKLAASLDGTKRTRAEEQKSMKRFAADVDRAGKAQEKQQAQIEKTLAAQAKAKVTAEELADAEKKAKIEVAAKSEQDRKDRLSSQQSRIRESAQAKSSSQQLYDTYTNLGSGTDLLKTRFFDLAGDSMKGQMALQVFAAGVEGAAKAIGTYSTALYKGERGAIVSAKALTDLVSPVLKVIDTLGIIVQVGSFFVPGGLLVKGAVAAGGALLSLGAKAGEVALKFNEIAAEQADKLFKSFQLLSRSGAAGARGMDDVFDTMQAIGMTVAELDEFNDLISKNSQKLSLMGTTAAQGARAFADVAGGLYKSKLGEQLEMLGMNAGEQREAALSYMEIQARTGRLELRNTDLLIKKSADFARELDLAATLTGQTRKEQAAAREAALAETRFRAAMISAQQSGDTEKIARLDAAQQAAALAKAMGDERGFRGILQYAAGGMTTPEAVAAEQTYRVSEILARPNQSQIEMAQHMGASVKLQQEQLASATALVGNIDALQTDFVKSADFQQRISNLMEEANKQGFNGPDALQKVLETEQGKRIAAGGDTRLMVQAGRAQQSAAMTMDSVVSTFNGAATIHEIAAKTFDEAVKLFATTVGAKAVVGGTPTTGGTGTAVPGLPTVEMAESAAKVAKATADVVLEQAAVANDQLKEAEIELARLKTARASKEEQQKAQDKITQTLKEKEKLEQEEINAAREARQKQLEAKNARQRARREEAPTTGKAPPGTATPAPPGAPTPPLKNGRAETPEGIIEAMKSGALRDPSNTPASVKIPTGTGAAGTIGTYLEKVKQVESGGKNIPNQSGKGGAPTTTAFGHFQIIKPTFDGLVKKAGKDNPLFGKTFEDMQADTGLQAEAAKQLTDGNRQFLLSKKLPSSDPALYLAHFLGPGGASRVLAAADRTPIQEVVNPDAIASNPGVFNNVGTAGDLKAWADKKMGNVGYAANGGILRGPTSGYRAILHGSEAVVPLPDGESIPVNLRTGSGGGGMDNLGTAIENLRSDLREFVSMQRSQSPGEMSSLLSDLVDLQRRNNSTAERILQVSTN